MKKRKYKIVTTVLKKEIKLIGIDQEFIEEAIYALILKDTQAFVGDFSLEYVFNNSTINLPMGVYGASPKFKTRYPLLLNGLWRSIIMLGRGNFFAKSNKRMFR